MPIAVFAQSGLDPSFGNGGIAINEIGGPARFYPIAKAVVLQPDGKSIAGCLSPDSAHLGRFGIARFNTNGTPDSSFGVNGFVEITFPITVSTAPLSPNPTGVTLLRLETDGKINAIGTMIDGNHYDLEIARLNSNGSLDPTFGTGGIVTTPLDSGFAPVYSYLQPDGKILFLNQTLSGATTWGILRFNANGTADPTFGTGGSALFPRKTLFIPVSLTHQSDGKIIVVGEDTIGSGLFATAFAAMRVGADGTLDPAFGVKGEMKKYIDHPGNKLGESGKFVSIQTTGKIIIAGVVRYGFDNISDGIDQSAAISLNSDGTINSSFGTGGTFLFVRDSSSPSGLILQPDDKIVLIGPYKTFQSVSEYLFCERLTPGGQSDNSFNDNGIFITNVRNSKLSVTKGITANALVFQKDGSLIVAGTSRSAFSLFRITPSGLLDKTFLYDGLSLGVFAPTGSAVASSVVQADGKLVVGGSISGSTKDFALMRYTLDGVPDKSFGIDGVVTTDFNFSEDNLSTVLLQPDGKIIAVGISTFADSSTFSVLSRYLPSGTLDNTFGIGGKVIRSFSTPYYAKNYAALDKNGKILVGCYTFLGGTQNFALDRYNSDGSADNSFGVSGQVLTDFGGATIASAIAIQPDGKILAGIHSQTGAINIIMVRYDTEGNLDPLFGTDGKVFGTGGGAIRIALQPDGKILALTTDGITRFNATGTLDISYGTNGSAKDTASGNESIVSFIRLEDGRILATASRIAYASQNGGTAYIGTCVVLRFRADGKLDPTFGTDGRILTQADSSCYPNTACLDSVGRFLISGNALHFLFYNSVGGFDPSLTQPVSRFLTVAYLKTPPLAVRQFGLSQPITSVYPDPIRGSTTIEYTLTKESDVSIDLVNISGQVVQHLLVAKHQFIGEHRDELQIDPSLSTGAYIVRVTTSEGVANVKVMVK